MLRSDPFVFKRALFPFMRLLKSYVEREHPAKGLVY